MSTFARRLLRRPAALRGAAAAACGCALNAANERFHLIDFGECKPLKRAASVVLCGGDAANYIMGKTLGEGAFAVVKVAERRDTSEKYACKLVHKDHSDQALLEREVSVLRVAGKHRHLVSLVDVFDTEDAWALVLELVSGGEVFDRICDLGSYSEREAAAVVRQVALALRHIHVRGIVHRDLKPENLLLVSDAPTSDVKVCDFGLAQLTGEGAPPVRGKTGTLAYMAPEQLSGGVYSTEVDLWALGVILFILLSGYHPFDPTSTAPDSEVERRIRSNNWNFGGPEWSKVSDDAKEMVRRLLTPDPARRATVREILESPWVGGETASAAPLQINERLREFNDARKTWRAAIRAAALIGRSPCAASASSCHTSFRAANLAPGALDELRAAFQAYDTDSSGKIELAELRAMMTSLGMPDGEAERTLRAADHSGDGTIGFEEFCAAVGPVYEHSKVALQRAFAVFDSDGSGSIDREELATMLTKLHLIPADADQRTRQATFERMWAMADTNQDGFITLDEVRRGCSAACRAAR